MTSDLGKLQYHSTPLMFLLLLTSSGVFAVKKSFVVTTLAPRSEVFLPYPPLHIKTGLAHARILYLHNSRPQRSYVCKGYGFFQCSACVPHDSHSTLSFRNIVWGSVKKRGWEFISPAPTPHNRSRTPTPIPTLKSTPSSTESTPRLGTQLGLLLYTFCL